MQSTSFVPDWVSHPGETIQDILNERSISKNVFADLVCQDISEAADLLSGRLSITLNIARKLEAVLGGSVEFWVSRDNHYREAVAQRTEDAEGLLSDLPIGDMIRFGWISPRPRADEEVESCLDFFGVEATSDWHRYCEDLGSRVRFRASQSFDSRLAAVAAWLRQGEIEAGRIQCREWDERRFEEALREVRALTREKDPSVFLPKLQRACAMAGVALAIVRSPSGCRASGAAYFIAESKAVIQLSFRYLSDDQFWFSFFHEAAHLLLHRNEGLILEGEGEDSRLEAEANAFAQELLIPRQHNSELLALGSNDKAVIRFARMVGVSPGIVVGQLQFRNRIGYNRLNHLKRRYQWAR